MGSADLGSVYIQATFQCSPGVLRVEAELDPLKYKVTSAISRNNHNL